MVLGVKCLIATVFKFKNLCCFATQPTHFCSQALAFLANIIFSIYWNAQVFLLLLQNLITENGGEQYMKHFPTCKCTHASSLKSCKCLSFRHGFACLLNIFCIQSLPFVQTAKAASASFTHLSPKLKQSKDG